MAVLLHFFFMILIQSCISAVKLGKLNIFTLVGIHRHICRSFEEYNFVGEVYLKAFST